MKDEIWKDCKHYEGLYQVSNYGRVKGLKRTIICKNGVEKPIEEKYITQHDNGNGYLFVNLYKHNKSKREYVHRLVAMAFIPNPENKPTVNHKDEDKQNNHVDNLEWMTYKENNNYGTHNERGKETRDKNGTNEKQRQRWITNNPAKTNPKTRGKNAYAKKVFCNGLVFECIKDCAEHFKINYGTMRGYLSNKKRKPKRFVDMNLSYV